MGKDIEVKIIKRPKGKPLDKFKIYGSTYYLLKDDEHINVFLYKSYAKEKVGTTVISSVFNINICKNMDYIDLDRRYNEEINIFNKQEYKHCMYTTNCILDNVYKHLKTFLSR